MQFKSLICAAIIFAANTLSAQDVVIFSEYSEAAVKGLDKLSTELEESHYLKAFKLEAFKVLNESYTKYADTSFEVDPKLAEPCKAIAEKHLKVFKKKILSLPKEERKEKIDAIKTEIFKAIKEEVNQVKAEALKPITTAINELTNEKNTNKAIFDKLTTTEALADKATITLLLKNWKEASEQAILTTKGDFIKEIKENAHETTTLAAEKKYPFPPQGQSEKEALEKFRLYKVGDKVSIKFAPTPNRVQTASGAIRAIGDSKIKIGFSSVNIKDILDPIVRDGMSKAKTLKNREEYAKKIITVIKKRRLNYYDDNLQKNADLLINQNEQKGYILSIGKWTPIAKVADSFFNRNLKKWRQAYLNKLENASLQNSKLIEEIRSNTSSYRKLFSKVIEEADVKLISDTEQLTSEAGLEEEQEFTEEDLEEIERKEVEEKAKLKAEKDKANLDALKRKQAAKRKQEAIAAQNAASKENNSMTLIIVFLLIIGVVAFVAFNPKIRNKIFSGGKKKSMHDIVSNLQAPDGSTPAPAAPPVPGAPGGPGPNGSMAPTPAAPTPVVPAEKTQIDLDDGLSIERGEDDAPEATQAAPRKKISLNLGSSTTTSLDKDGLDSSKPEGLKPVPPAGGLTPPGGGLTPPGGGLTPPGGGLTPPGGGLTPPGGGLKPPGGGLPPPGGNAPLPGSESNDEDSSSENSDKSNLIINPNLNGSGDKLRLKK